MTDTKKAQKKCDGKFGGVITVAGFGYNQLHDIEV